MKNRLKESKKGWDKDNRARYERNRAEYRGANSQRWQFPSLDSFLDTVQDCFVSGVPHLIEPARAGSVEYVPKARALLERFSTELSSIVPVNAMSVAGGLPIIPAVLSNHVECFQSKRFERVETIRPVKIFYSVVRTEDNDTMLERGIAALAYAMRLSESRPVEFYTFNHGGCMKDANGQYTDNYFTMTIRASMPICLSELCYVLTSESYATKLCYALEQVEMGYLSVTPRAERRKALGCGPDDLVFDHTFGEADPVRWIERHIEEQNSK